jgi:hypothetical protein
MRTGHLATMALVCLVAFAAGSASAQAGQIVVGPTIHGSGSISSGTYVCGPAHGANAVALTCPVLATGTLGSPDTPVVVLLATPAAVPAGQWVFSSWIGCPLEVGNQCVLTYTGTLSSPFSIGAVFVDLVAPTVSAPVADFSTTSERTVDLSWSADEGATFTCSLDFGPLTPCSSPLTVSLLEGVHSLRVQATDTSGNVGAVGAPLSFRVLDTALVSGPADLSNDATPSFAFSTVAGSGFDCSLDGGAFADCGTGGANGVGFTTLAHLGDGAHAFSVRAKSGADFDRIPATRTWTVDTTAPTTAFTTGPSAGSSQSATAATFGFAASEPGVLECSLDAAAFSACASPETLTHLASGPHTFRVRATDRAGNIGAAAARSWNVGSAGTLTASSTKPITKRVRVLLAFAGTAAKDSTWFTKLQVKEVPSGSTVQVTCGGTGCPSGLKGKGYTKKHASGTITLAKFIKKPIKVKTKLTFLVSKPNTISAVKTLELRAGKSPLLTTRCRMPGAKVSVAC